jgi:hypothetical protein
VLKGVRGWIKNYELRIMKYGRNIMSGLGIEFESIN